MRELKLIRTEMAESSQRPEAKLDEVTADVTALKDTTTTLAAEVGELRQENGEMRKQLDNLESQSRRNNMIIRGVDEPDHRETWEQCESTVRDKLSSTLGMGKDRIKNIPIERAHRLPKPGRQTEQLRDKPRDIIVKFSFFKDRDVVLEAARTKKPPAVYFMERT